MKKEIQNSRVSKEVASRLVLHEYLFTSPLPGLAGYPLVGARVWAPSKASAKAMLASAENSSLKSIQRYKLVDLQEKTTSFDSVDLWSASVHQGQYESPIQLPAVTTDSSPDPLPEPGGANEIGLSKSEFGALYQKVFAGPAPETKTPPGLRIFFKGLLFLSGSLFFTGILFLLQHLIFGSNPWFLIIAAGLLFQGVIGRLVYECTDKQFWELDSPKDAP